MVLTHLFWYVLKFAGSEPAQCEQIFQIEQDRIDIFIVPGVVNCFSCASDTMDDIIAWQVELDDDLVPETSPLVLEFGVEVVGNFLVIAMPESYVLPGTAGRRNIACFSVISFQLLEARLASPSKNG